jgi:hypothetical protein
MLRELERALQDHLEKIRATLAVSENRGHDVLLAVADRFLECLPAPVLIRDKNGDCYWKNPAYLKTMSESDEEENLADLDSSRERRQGGFCLVHLKASAIHDAPDSIPFDTWQFDFADADGKEFTGDLLLPHASVESAMRCEGVLLSIPSVQTSVNSGRALLDCQAAFIEKLPVAAVIKDLGGRYQWANSAMMKEVEHERFCRSHGMALSTLARHQAAETGK